MASEPTALFADVTVEGGVLTARLVGPSIGQREGPIIASTIEAKFVDAAPPVRHVVLDFADVTYINSSGLGSCVTIHNQAKSQKAGVVLYRMRDDIRDVFKMTRMDKIFKIAPDEKKLAKFVK